MKTFRATVQLSPPSGCCFCEAVEVSRVPVCSSAELQAKQQAMEDMRLALTEQEETQQQMEQVLDDKMRLMQELSAGETPTPG